MAKSGFGKIMNIEVEEKRLKTQKDKMPFEQYELAFGKILRLKIIKHKTDHPGNPTPVSPEKMEKEFEGAGCPTKGSEPSSDFSPDD